MVATAAEQEQRTAHGDRARGRAAPGQCTRTGPLPLRRSRLPRHAVQRTEDALSLLNRLLFGREQAGPAATDRAIALMLQISSLKKFALLYKNQDNCASSLLLIVRD
jgi:hypothetical protein